MNFSDETVEKVAKALSWYPDRGNYDCAKAALSSLTLADLMGVDEVRELVEESKRAEDLLDALLPEINGSATAVIIGVMNDLHNKLTPFTEAK